MTTIVTTDVVNGTATDAGVVNANFAAVKSTVNGNIDDTNIVPGANINPAKILPGAETYVLTTVAGAAAWVSPSGGAGASIPVGCGVDYWGSSAPSGWLFADGSAISRTTYADLFAVMGTQYGAGDGSTTFNLPDKQARVSVMKGTHTSVDTLGENDGVAIANRRPQHRHTVTGGHVHTYEVSGGGVGTGAAGSASGGGFTVGNASDALDAPAHIVCNYIVYTGV